jgi:hypothetical protein
VQFCPNCGAERVSKVHFDGPRYRRTQDAIPDFVAAPFQIEVDAAVDEADGFTPMAA